MTVFLRNSFYFKAYVYGFINFSVRYHLQSHLLDYILYVVVFVRLP